MLKNATKEDETSLEISQDWQASNQSEMEFRETDRFLTNQRQKKPTKMGGHPHLTNKRRSSGRLTDKGAHVGGRMSVANR